jgi:hypothetical protein
MAEQSSRDEMAGTSRYTRTAEELRLTPHGRLVLAHSDEAPPLDPALAERLPQAFARGAGYGLLRLGAAEVGPGACKPG